MRGLKKELKKDMELEKRILGEYTRELARLPKGSLSRYEKGGRVYYKHSIYIRGKDGVSRRADRHLGEKDGDLIYALQRKAYIKETIRRIAKNLRVQEKIEAKYEPYDFYSVREALSNVYQPDNVKRFLEQEGYELEHVDAAGQNYRPQGLVQNTSGDFSVRSKGESLIAEALMARKIVFRFEKEFRVKLASGQIIILHPDFVIPLRDGSVILWEHLGLLSSKKYAADAGERLHLYNLAGFRPGSNLILTADDQEGYTDMKAIAQILDRLEEVCLFEE